jgi:tRNA (cmo5U34)-methyltransferase
MSHSVERHLAVAPAQFDAEIRRFVPGYELMLQELVGAVAEHLPRADARVLDLGAGTGALTQRLLERFEGLCVVLLDADPAMLDQARQRLAAHRQRVELVEGSFSEDGALPRCDLAVASLALHHLHRPQAKQAAYRAILEALPAGGVLVNGDVAIPGARALAEPLVRRWAAHLVTHGDSLEQAYARFASWAAEDTYLGLEQELDLLRAAGFAQVEVRWRAGPLAVLLARKA